MTLNFRIWDEQTYVDRRLREFENFEGNKATAYGDTVGIVTIGIGLNMRVQSNRVIIYELFGIGVSESNSNGSDTRTYRERLKEVLIADWTALPGESETDRDFRLQAALDSIMQERYDNLSEAEKLTARNTFSLTSTEIEATFAERIKAYEQIITNTFSWLDNGPERLALLSLCYNGVLGSNLISAVNEDNRALSWYEIRYNSNGGSSASNGIANRRNAESDLFGLFNEVNDKECRDAYIMYRDKKDILHTYEQKYAAVFNSSNSIQTQLSPATEYLNNVYSLPLGGAKYNWNERKAA